MPADVAFHESLEDTERAHALTASLELLASRAERLLTAIDADDAELSITLCDDDAIQALNAEWRGKDVATDVLSFPQGEMPPGAPRHLGDVVISVDTAARQASELGHGLDDELGVLLTHGLLHLLGHDHDDDEDRAEMLAEEQHLLQALGLEKQGLIGRAG
jgi:probable rRNA maturation factor